MIVLLFVIISAVVRAEIVVEDATEFSSLDGESGFAPWTNPNDADCSSPLSAASRCFANTASKPLRSSSFPFSLPAESVAYWVRAEWNVSLSVVPFGGWRVVFVELRWGGNQTNRFAPPSDPRLQQQDLFLEHTWNESGVNLSTVSTLVAFETGLEDVVFLVQCSKLRANVSATYDATRSTSYFTAATGAPHRPRPSWIPMILGGISVPILIFGACMYRLRNPLSLVQLNSAIAVGRSAKKPLNLVGVAVAARVTETNFTVEHEGTLGGVSEIKCHLLKDEDAKADSFKDLMFVRNEYVLRFVGVHVASGLYTVWDQFRGVPLSEYLASLQEIHTGHLMVFVMRTICALHALHAADFPHGEVATRNVIVDDQDSFKLANAGHARRFDVDKYVKQRSVNTPLRWMAPETIKNDVLNTKSDVWGLGIFSYEVFSAGSVPLGTTPNIDYVELVTKGGLDLEMPTHATKELWEMLSPCLERDPDERPTIEVLRDDIITLREAMGYGDAMEDISLMSDVEGKMES